MSMLCSPRPVQIKKVNKKGVWIGGHVLLGDGLSMRSADPFLDLISIVTTQRYMKIILDVIQILFVPSTKIIFTSKYQFVCIFFLYYRV